MSGWIKIHRKILDWEWYDDSNTFRLFMHLLLKANHKDKKYRGIVVETGSILTGRDLLSIETGLSVQQVRTCLERLKSTNEITINSSRQGTIIQIVKYKDYQVSTNDLTENQPKNNQQVTTNKNVKNNKEENNINIEERKQKFAISLNPYLEKYGREFLNDFYLYWTEPTLNNKKLKYELEKTWSLDRRLSTWETNAKKYGTVLPKKNNEQWKPEWL